MGNHSTSVMLAKLQGLAKSETFDHSVNISEELPDAPQLKPVADMEHALNNILGFSDLEQCTPME